jgi:NAD(P)-dependent dehydrogenase (short-subunit alcohol dehydrogenase family)
MELEGQLALVTGGAAGIGAAITRRLAEEGADVAIVDISPIADEAMAKLSVKPDQRIKSWRCDVTRPSEVSSVYENIRRQLGDPTILINNVGGSGPNAAADIESTTDEVWDYVLSLNVGSAFRFCRAVAAAMKAKRYGKIVNVSSTLANGMLGPAGTVGARIPYVTAKSAIIGLTKQLAKDLGPFGIAVNAIAPGFTLPDPEARITKKFNALSPDEQRPLVGNIPMGRPGSGQDMAHVVGFLASPRNTYVTGQILAVDGGA